MKGKPPHTIFSIPLSARLSHPHFNKHNNIKEFHNSAFSHCGISSIRFILCGRLTTISKSPQKPKSFTPIMHALFFSLQRNSYHLPEDTPLLTQSTFSCLSASQSPTHSPLYIHSTNQQSFIFTTWTNQLKILSFTPSSYNTSFKQSFLNLLILITPYINTSHSPQFCCYKLKRHILTQNPNVLET